MSDGHITPVESGKTTLSRYAGLVTDLVATVGKFDERLSVEVAALNGRLILLERSDRTFKTAAIVLLVILIGGTVWCGVEVHRLNETLLRLHGAAAEFLGH